MRKAVSVTAVIVAILLAEAVGQVAVVDANMIMSRSIVIQSPIDFKDRIYQTSTISLSIHASEIGSSPGIKRISYSLDGKPNVTLSITQGYTEASGTGTLENLTDGYHTLTAYALPNLGIEISTSTVFAVNASKTVIYSTPPPIPTPYPTSSPAPVHYLPVMISPLNQTTYNTNQVPLVYTINSSVFYSYYSIDSPSPNNGWTSFDGNITLPSLSEGQHNLALNVATYEPHQTYSTIQTVTFYIHTVDATPTPNPVHTSQPSPTPTVPEFSLLAIITLMVSILSVAVAFRRHRKTINLKQ
jgi:hypothetical protein